jgi:hypothetical protein
MALWSNTDANTSAPKYAVAGGLGVSANGSQLYANTTASAFVSGATIGVFGVDSTEIGLANNKSQSATHSGWVLRTEGSGGRSGRITTEVLVAMGSMGADADLTANDNAVFANT